MARDISTQFFGDCDQMYRENGLLSTETLLIIFSFKMFHNVVEWSWKQNKKELSHTQTSRERERDYNEKQDVLELNSLALRLRIKTKQIVTQNTHSNPKKKALPSKPTYINNPKLFVLLFSWVTRVVLLKLCSFFFRFSNWFAFHKCDLILSCNKH